MNVKEMRKEIRKVYPKFYIDKLKNPMKFTGREYMYFVYEDRSHLNRIGFGYTIESALEATIRNMNSTAYGVEKG